MLIRLSAALLTMVLELHFEIVHFSTFWQTLVDNLSYLRQSRQLQENAHKVIFLLAFFRKEGNHIYLDQADILPHKIDFEGVNCGFRAFKEFILVLFPKL